MAKTFYIADTHFKHANIIRFDGRPFGSISEMDRVLINNWNRTVCPEDTVYILGDFCWSRKPFDWEYLLCVLHGHKVLVRGNHDSRMPESVARLFDEVCDYKEIIDGGRKVVLCHYPILFYNGSFNLNCYMLCGHVHVTAENILLEKFIREIRQHTGPCGNIINVGCMMPWMGYTPQTLDEIIHGWRASLDAA